MKTSEASAGEFYLLWDGPSSTIPSGWYCVSCAPTDGGTAASTTFWNAFPRASSTYGAATSGADTVTHTLTLSASSSANATTGVSSATAGKNVSKELHSHTWGTPTLRAEDIRPLYTQLIMIHAVAPTQIPKGVIAMFPGTSSNLPRHWAYYDGIENRYLRTSNSTTTGGSATYAATTTASVVSGNSTGSLVQVTTSGQTNIASGTHVHIIATGTAITSNTANPSYIGVVFAKAETTTTIPDGILLFADTTTMPSQGWVVTSTAGSIWSNNLIIGSSTFGSTGGVTTHNHGGSTILTSGTSTNGTFTTRSGSAASAAANTHAHAVTYTVDSQSSMPVNRMVIVAQKKPSLLTQAQYQWYQNVNSDTPTVSLAGVNSSTTVASGTIYRLRMNVRNSTSTLYPLNEFKLQFQAATTTGSWTDVGQQASTSVAWITADNNNATTTDGSTLPTLLLPSSTVKETYEETPVSAGTPNQVDFDFVNNAYWAEWDWVIQPNGISQITNYYFRMVFADGTAFNSYERYPVVTTPDFTTCSTNISSTDFGNLDTSAVSTSTPDASTTMTCSGALGCSLQIDEIGGGSHGSIYSSSTNHSISGSTGNLVAGTEDWGAQATTTATGSGGNLNILARFNQTGDTVGIFTSTVAVVASSTTSFTDRELLIKLKAAISSGTSVANDYQGTMTYSCYGN